MVLVKPLKDRVCILYFFARLSAILSGIQLEICAKMDILFFCGFMLSPMVAGKLPLRWHELFFFQVLRKNMGWLWKKSTFFIFFA